MAHDTSFELEFDPFLPEMPVKKEAPKSGVPWSEYQRLYDPDFVRSTSPKQYKEREELILKLNGPQQNQIIHDWFEAQEDKVISHELHLFHQLDKRALKECREALKEHIVFRIDQFAEIDGPDAEWMMEEELEEAKVLKRKVNMDLVNPPRLEERSYTKIGRVLNNFHKIQSDDKQGLLLRIAQVAPWQILKRLDSVCDASTKDTLKELVRERNMEKLVDDPLEIQECLRMYLQNKRYQGLLDACEVFDVRPPIDKPLFEALLENELENGNAHHANLLFRLARMNHIPVDTQTEQRIQEKAEEEQLRREQRPKRELVERGIQVVEEAVRFYANQNILTELTAYADAIVREEQLRGTTYPFRIKVQIEELAQQISKENEQARKWIREYFIEAVQQELVHQTTFLEESENDLALPIPPSTQDPYNDASYRFKSLATDEEIRVWLAQVEERFLHPKWKETSFGGKPWATITRAALELWKPHPSPGSLFKRANERFSATLTKEKVTPDATSIWVDHAFDLQHNNDTIFDKNPSRIKLDAVALKQFLEFKKHAVSPKDVLAHIEELLREYDPTSGTHFSSKLQKAIFGKMDQLQALERDREKLNVSYRTRTGE